MSLQAYIFDDGLVVRGSTSTIQIPHGSTSDRPSSPTGNGHLRANDDTNELDVYLNSIWKQVNYKIRWSTINANFAIPSGDSGLGYWVDSRTNPLSITLPATPINGTVIVVGDYGASAKTNNITILHNGNNINYVAGDYVIVDNNSVVAFQYVDATVGWKTVYGYIDASAKSNLNSPVFTGNPKAPTPSAGTVDTSIATMEALNIATSGVLILFFGAGGDFIMDIDQAGNPILVLNGALTVNSNLIIPHVSGQWTIQNNTTGAYTVTVKTAAGTGVLLKQGKSNIVYSDLVNVYPSRTDFDNIALTGIPTVPTASPLTNSTQISSTAYTDAADTVVANNALAYSIIFG